MDATLQCLLTFGLTCFAPAAGVEPTVVALAPAPAQTPADAPASLFLARVQAFYDGTTDLSADFTQTYVHPVYGTKSVTKGKLKVRKPGMMIWDYDKAEDPDFYADGATLWVVERDTQQVVRQKVDGSDFAGAVAFLFGGRKLIDEFKVRHAPKPLVERYGRAGHRLLELKPRAAEPSYKGLLLLVAPESGEVVSFVVRNGDDSINVFDLSKVKRNPGLAKELFAFKVPKGFSVIDE